MGCESDFLALAKKGDLIYKISSTGYVWVDDWVDLCTKVRGVWAEKTGWEIDDDQMYAQQFHDIDLSQIEIDTI